MSNSTAHLGGGYAESTPDAAPTVQAVLDAASSGDREARLVVIAGPPGCGKSTLARYLLARLPGSCCVDKDWVAGGFILQAAKQDDLAPSAAYGSPRYWQHLRPLEYGGAVTSACAQLIDRRTVLLLGGWGPELAAFEMWPLLAEAVAPSSLQVLHLDAPAVGLWQTRMQSRGSRADSPWFEDFAARLSASPVWSGAHRLSTDGSIHDVAQQALSVLSSPPLPR
jgi:energy-coupling factor transporter ATP-binding protein EcfA2